MLNVSGMKAGSEASLESLSITRFAYGMRHENGTSLVDQQLKNVKKVVTKINSAVKHLVDVVLETEWFVGLKTVGEGCINNVTGFIKLVLARLGIPLDALNGDIVATAVAGDRQTVGVGVGLNSRDLCRCASNQHGAHRN